MTDHSQLLQKYARLKKEIKELEDEIRFLDKNKEDKPKRAKETDR